VLSAANQGRSGVASAVNNAVARVAGLVAIAAVGAAVAGQFATSLDGRLAPASHDPAVRAPITRAQTKTLVIDAGGFPPAERALARQALVAASIDGYRLALEIAAALAFASGLVSLAGITNARLRVAARDCAGGPLQGASVDVAGSA